MIKKILSVLVAGVMCIGMCTSVGATNSFSKSKTLYVSSKSIPQSAVTYARDMFTHFNTMEMESLGYTATQAVSLKLGKGFVVDNYYTDSNLEAYYFPILLNGTVSNILIVFKVNGTYGFQMGNQQLASALNGLSTSQNSPVKIVTSDVAYYAVSNNNVTVLDSDESILSADIQDNINAQSDSLSNQASLMSASATNVVSINSNTAYSDTIKTVMARSDIGIIRPVPQCNNIVYDNAPYAMVCWAACGGAMVEYYQNGSVATQSGANEHRLYIAAKNSYEPASIDNAKTYIEERISDIGLNYTLSIDYSKLSWNEVKFEINNNDAPFYTEWRRPGYSHAMVVKGYTYDNTAPSNTNYYKISIMDPDHGTIISSYNNGINIFGTGVYTWTNTIIRN